MYYNRYCVLFLGFLALIAFGSADFDQPQANQPQPPILPNRWTAIGQLAQGYPSNDTYIIYYDWNAQMQRVDQFVSGSQDTHTFLIVYSTQMLYMFIERNGNIKSCMTSPYYQKMPPPNLFAGATFQGHATIHGKDCNGWKLENSWNGNMHLWVTVDTNTPVRIASYGSRFDLSEFKPGSFNPNVFTVPNASTAWLTEPADLEYYESWDKAKGYTVKEMLELRKKNSNSTKKATVSN